MSCFWSPWTDPYIMRTTIHDVTLTVKTFMTSRTSIRRELFMFCNLRVYVLITMIPSGSSTCGSGEPTCVPSGILRPLSSSLTSAWGSPSAFFDSVPRLCHAIPVCRQSVMVCTSQQIKKSEKRILRFSARCWLPPTPVGSLGCPWASSTRPCLWMAASCVDLIFHSWSCHKLSGRHDSARISLSFLLREPPTMGLRGPLLQMNVPWRLAVIQLRISW